MNDAAHTRQPAPAGCGGATLGGVGVAVVTGASRGLGAALAGLVDAGYAVGACATSTPDGPWDLCRRVDVTDAAAVERFAAEVAERLGPIDVWVNNAGVVEPVGPVGRIAPAAWQRCLDVNLGGALHGTRAFIAHRSIPTATLVNVASRAGVAGLPGLAAYSAAKAAVIALTTSVAAEESAAGLRAFAVVPPSMDTAMQAVLQSASADDFPLVEQWRRRMQAGGVVPAGTAAAWVLEAVLGGDVSHVVVDLSART